MAEIFAAKRQATTQKLEETKEEKSGVENVDSRKARLLA